MEPLASGSAASSSSLTSRLGHLRPRALSAGAREEEGRVWSGSEGEEAKRVKASWMSRSVEAEMLFWRARGEGLLGWVVAGGGGGRLVGREREGGCGVVSCGKMGRGWDGEERGSVHTIVRGCLWRWRDRFKFESRGSAMTSWGRGRVARFESCAATEYSTLRFYQGLIALPCHRTKTTSPIVSFVSSVV